VLDVPKSSVSSPAQSMVFIWISAVLDSSAEMTWSIVYIYQPGLLKTELPSLIKLGFFMFLVEHTWLVIIIPVE
jgi:hypothetical protein